MVRQARVLAQATSDLVNAMRSDAEAEVDVDNSKKLLAAAKLLADATARMVEAAKVSHEAIFIHLYSLMPWVTFWMTAEPKVAEPDTPEVVCVHKKKTKDDRLWSDSAQSCL